MWRLYPLLRPLWALLVATCILGLPLELAGNCAYDAFTSEGCQLSVEDARELPQRAAIGIPSAFVLQRVS